MRSWGRDTIRESWILAATFLALGAAVYHYFCDPVVTQRGYPPIDPKWDVPPFFFVIPILLSAVYLKAGRARRILMLLYALAITPVFGIMLLGPSVTPRYVMWPDYIFGMLALPLVYPVIWIVDRVSLTLVDKVRALVPRSGCGKCGYDIRFLTEPRCPECGTAFDARLLGEGSAPLRGRLVGPRTATLAAVLLAAAASSPFLYEEARLADATSRGRSRAERDWTAGRPLLYLPRGRWIEHGQYDFDTGLEMRREHAGLSGQRYSTAYRDEVNRRIAEHGLPPRRVDVLTRSELAALLSSVGLQELHEKLLAINSHVQVRRGDPMSWSMTDAGTTITVPFGRTIRYAVIPERRNMVIVVVDDYVRTFDELGNPLQSAVWIEGEIVDE